jgi:hypothetical protein
LEICQQILSDTRKNNNKIIVIYDFKTGEKEVAHQPSNTQELDFDTVEVITRDNQNQGVNLKEECLDFIKQEGWVKTKDFVFRVNAAEEYEALNLKGNGKNKL